MSGQLRGPGEGVAAPRARRTRRRAATVLLGPVVLLLAAALLPACSSGQPSVTIGALYPTTGSQGPQGSEELRGVQLAAQFANANGGVHGRKIRLVTAPADRAEAVPAAMDALHRRGVDIVVGSHGSTISAVAADIASEQHMLFWETGAVGETDGGVNGGTNFIRMAPMGANLGRAGIAFVRDQLAAKLGHPAPLRYSVAYVDDAYGRAVGLGARQEIESSGQVLAASIAYPPTGADFADVARRIAAAGTDVLFVSAYLDDGIALRTATVDAGVPLVASIGTSSSYCLPAFGARLGPDATGLFASDKPDAADVRPDALSAEGRKALEWVEPRYQSRFHEPMSAPALSGFSNAVALFAHALPAATDLHAAAVAAAALATKLPEGTLANGGGMDIAPPGAVDSGNNRAAASVIWEWLPGGQRAVVWPPAFANHAIEPLPLA
jgi:branched-chain amino acid transport system substrate-binding protein